MKTEIVGQWTEKVKGNVFTDSRAKMTLYTFTDNAFNDIPNKYWILLLSGGISAETVIQEVSGKKSKTTRGMIGVLEYVDLTLKSLNEIIQSPLKSTHLEALAVMKKFDYTKLKDLLKLI